MVNRLMLILLFKILFIDEYDEPDLKPIISQHKLDDNISKSYNEFVKVYELFNDE